MNNLPKTNKKTKKKSYFIELKLKAESSILRSNRLG